MRRAADEFSGPARATSTADEKWQVPKTPKSCKPLFEDIATFGRCAVELTKMSRLATNRTLLPEEKNYTPDIKYCHTLSYLMNRDVTPSNTL
jgi:hypothetical protein